MRIDVTDWALAARARQLWGASASIPPQWEMRRAAGFEVGMANDQRKDGMSLPRRDALDVYVEDTWIVIRATDLAANESHIYLDPRDARLVGTALHAMARTMRPARQTIR